MNDNNPEPLAVNATSAARMMGISLRTLRALVASGELRPSRVGPGRRIHRFRIPEIERYLRDCESGE